MKYLSISRKYWLRGLFLVGTAILMKQSWEFGMMGLTTFTLAYMGKGIRRDRSSNS